MRALDDRVVAAVWQAVERLIPIRPPTNHPLGCHRPRIADRVCFEAILFRLVTGCSWDVAGRLGKGSETTLRNRRDEWLEAEVFDRLVEEAIAGYDKIIGLDLSEVAIDGSQHKAPFGGQGTGPNPTDRGQTGLEMVSGDRPSRHPRRVGYHRSQPSRHHLVVTHPGFCRQKGSAHRHRNSPPRPRLRQPPGAQADRRRRDRRPGL